MNGDLVITVKIEEDNIYRRVNDDLVSDLEISITDAIFGGIIEYSTIDGSVKSVEIKPGTQANKKIIIKNLVKSN